MDFNFMLFNDELNNKPYANLSFSPRGIFVEEALKRPSGQFDSGKRRMATIQILSKDVSVKSTLANKFAFNQEEASNQLKTHSYLVSDKKPGFVASGFAIPG